MPAGCRIRHPAEQGGDPCDRVTFGEAGRDVNAVSRTAGGLPRLLYPGAGGASDADIEWAVRIVMKARRRVKEQQQRIGVMEFRNTHFSYAMGADGVEQFVSIPELHSENSIDGDPLDPGHVWTIAPGGGEDQPGMHRIEVNEGPGGGARMYPFSRLPRQ